MKLLTLLKSLRPEEYPEFEKFLQSPYFKASPQYLSYFRYLRKRHPDFVADKTALQAAYRHCFGPGSLTESKLYNLMSGLGKQVEQFIVVQMALAEGNGGCSLRDQLLVKSLGNRNMGAYFRAEAQQLLDATAACPVLATDDFLAIHQLHCYVYFNPDTPKRQEHPSHLQLAAEKLDQYYCQAQLFYAAEMMARARILDVRYELPLLDAVLEYSARPGQADAFPSWNCYFQLVQLYRRGIDEAGFRALIAQFVINFGLLPSVDSALLLRHLINCGIALVARDCAVEAEVLTLYKLGLNAGLIVDGNRITHLGFVNIANLAGSCREFEWAAAFIDRYAVYLEEDKRQAAIDLARAGVYYNLGRLDEAQRRLTPELFGMPGFDLLCRSLLLKIALDRYLLSDRDYAFLVAFLKAFEKYVRTKALAEEKKKAHLNWIRFVRKMAALKSELVEVPAAQKEVLRKTLSRLQPFIGKKWVAQKIEIL